MPQNFQVLRCYKCLVFQVHQSKKSNKFECKLCGEKQSIKRHYGLGTGKDCRLHVQKLNGIRGELDELSSSLELTREESDEDTEHKQGNTKATIENVRQNKSKWSEYLEKEEIPEIKTEETMYLDNKEVVLEVPKKKFRRLGRHFKNPATTVPKSTIKSDEYEEIYSNDVHSNGMVDFSVNDSVPLSTDAKLQSIKNYDCVTNHSSNLQSDTKNIEFKPITVKKEEKVSSKQFVPPAVKSNSKWAQFVENEDQKEDECNKIPPSYHDVPTSKDPQPLFSLCDDSDLDNVLDI